MFANLFTARKLSSSRSDHSLPLRLEVLEERLNPQTFVSTGVPEPILVGALAANVAPGQGVSFVSSALIGSYNLYTEGGLPGEPQNAVFLASQVNTGEGTTNSGGGGTIGPSAAQLNQLQQMVQGLYVLSAQQNLQQTNNLVIDEGFLGVETFTYFQGLFLGTSPSPSVLSDMGVHTTLINQDPVFQTPAGHSMGDAVFDLVLGTELVNHPNAI